MIPDRMQANSAHCGPVAIAHALQIKAAQVMANWPDKWIDHRTDKKCFFWPIDTPWNHEKYLESQDLKSVEIIGDKFAENDIVLLHNVNAGKNAITQFICGLIYQHWCRVLSDEGDLITVDFGTIEQPTRQYDRASFMRLVDGAWPRSAYRIS